MGTEEDLLKYILDNLPDKKDFKPGSYRYSKEGDFLECFYSDVDYYGEWINPYLVIYLSSETDEIVGININGVKKFIDIIDNEDPDPKQIMKNFQKKTKKEK